jgi:hypothetical protein
VAGKVAIYLFIYLLENCQSKTTEKFKVLFREIHFYKKRNLVAGKVTIYLFTRKLPVKNNRKI